MVEFTQQQLRNLSPTVRRQIAKQSAQQISYEASVKQYEAQQATAQQQSVDLQQRIAQLKADIKVLEVKETRGSMGQALEAASTKYGKQAEVKRLQELSSGLSSGGYYSNYDELISGAKVEGKYVASSSQASFNPAIQSQKQVVTTYEKIYTDDRGQPISIAPSIAEAQLATQREAAKLAETKMSIAPSLAWTTPKPITQLTIKEHLTTPRAPIAKEKPKMGFGFKGGIFGYFVEPDINLRQVTEPVVKKVSSFNPLETLRQTKIVKEAKEPSVSYITTQSRGQAYTGYTGSGDVRIKEKLTIFEKAQLLQERTAESKIGQYFSGRKGKDELPYGIKTVQDIAVGKPGKEGTAVVKGEKFSIWAPQFYLGAKITESALKDKSKILFTERERSQAYISPTGTSQDIVVDKKEISGFKSWFFKPRPTTGVGTQLAASLPLTVFFAPAMQTGTAGSLERQAQAKKGLNPKAYKKLTKLERDLLNVKTRIEQEKILKTFIKKEKLGESAATGIRSYLQNTGILKETIVKVDLTKGIVSPRTDLGTIINPSVPTSTAGIRDVSLGAIRDSSLGKIGGEMTTKIGSNIQTNFGIGAEIMTNLNLQNMAGASVLAGTTGILGRIPVKEKDKLLKKVKTTPVIGYTLREVSAVKPDLKTKPTTRSAQLPTTSSVSLSATQQVPAQQQSLTTVQIPKTSSVLLSSLLSRTSQIQRQQLKQPQQQQPKLRQTQKTKTKVLKKLTSRFGGQKSISGFGKKSGYGAVAYKSGQPISLGTFGKQSEAAKELKDFLKETLSASGYLTKGEKKIKAKDTGLLGLEFRKGKKSSTLVVERKSKRLRKGTTGKQIQFFR